MMPKLITLTRERQSERWRATDHFIAQDHVDNPEKALRKAIDDYLFTPDGKDMINYSCGDFNWGDAVMSVSEECLNKHGIELKYDDKTYTISGDTIEITVNQDEVLIRTEHEDALDTDK